MPDRQQINLAPAIIAFLIILTTTACSDNKTRISAPPGEKQALEKLADAYRKISNSLPTSPAHLKPNARRKFIEQVFDTAGYDYSTTLLNLSGIQGTNINQHHKDLKQLLFLPHHNISLKDLPDLYSDQEMAAIEAITKNIN